MVEAGANVLAGANKDLILSHFNLNRNKTIKANAGLYGDGHAAEKIVSRLLIPQ